MVAPFTGGEILFSTELTRYDVSNRYASGARIVSRPAAGAVPAGADLLFVVRADGRLLPVTRTTTPEPAGGDTMILLEHALAGS